MADTLTLKEVELDYEAEEVEEPSVTPTPGGASSSPVWDSVQHILGACDSPCLRNKRGRGVGSTGTRRVDGGFVCVQLTLPVVATEPVRK